jgi:ElaB/YqjD/DUF883 family membrane-anchored ribosome-binding protein
LLRLKENCQRLSSEIAAKALATDKIVRRHPYTFLGAAVLLGFVAGFQLRKK